MDPLTQGLLGAAASQALLGERLGRTAWMIGAFGGMLPDADVFIRSAEDPLLEVEVHRGFTHALSFIPIGGVMAGAPWLIRARYREQWRAVLGAGLVGYGTHGLLDACTTYGTQLLWPFSSLRTAWNCISIVDPIFTLILLVGVIWAARARRGLPASMAIGLCMLYLGLGIVQRERAYAAQEHIAHVRGHEPSRRAVFPTIGNLVVWRSLYEDRGHLYADRIRVAPVHSPTWAPGSSVEALTAAEFATERHVSDRVLHDFERFSWFSNGWTARSPVDSTFIGDARYSLKMERFDPIWGVRFDPGGSPPTEWVNRTDAREMRLDALWSEITGLGAGYRPMTAPR
ncbi:MAG: metal-dependent hydrolase [Rhodothermales bacterium]